jgi:hypothetical protein
MKLKTLAQVLVLSGATTGLGATPGLTDQGHCRHVGGGIITNVLPPPPAMDCASSPIGLCTDGVATGDLSGAVGVAVIRQNGSAPNGYLHNHHHWVTASGDTIFFDDADLYLLADVNNQYLGNYIHGVTITGGNGAFEGASGFLDSVFGAIDLNQGQLTLRYAGTVCFARVPPP